MANYISAGQTFLTLRRGLEAAIRLSRAHDTSFAVNQCQRGPSGATGWTVKEAAGAPAARLAAEVDEAGTVFWHDPFIPMEDRRDLEALAFKDASKP